MTDFEAEEYIDIDEEPCIKIRDISPCKTCEFYPEKHEIFDPTYDSLIDTEYIPNDQCPMSVDFDWEIPVEVWENITCAVGCGCWKQRKSLLT